MKDDIMTLVRELHSNNLTTIGREKIKQKLLNKDKEIEKLNNKVEELMTLYTTERNVKEDYKTIIKEVRELRKQLAFEYYENGLEVGVNVVIEDLDKILDKGE